MRCFRLLSLLQSRPHGVTNLGLVPLLVCFLHAAGAPDKWQKEQKIVRCVPGANLFLQQSLDPSPSLRSLNGFSPSAKMRQLDKKCRAAWQWQYRTRGRAGHFVDA